MLKLMLMGKGKTTRLSLTQRKGGQNMLAKEIEELADLAGFALQYFDEFGIAENDCRRRLAYLAYKAALSLTQRKGGKRDAKPKSLRGLGKVA